MTALFRVFRRIWRRRIGALIVGILLSVAVLAAGLALLGLSGWFVTAAGAAGLAGGGLTFDVFRPSAGVRFLALGRAVARYGERLATHDATLKGLADLRVALLEAMLRKPAVLLSRLRGSERLNHLTIDVDALDGVALRLVMPAVAAAVVLAATFFLIAWLVLPSVAVLEIGSYLVGLAAALIVAARASRKPSRLAQRSAQALRMRFIDMMRGRTELAVSGRLEDYRRSVLDAHQRMQHAQSRTDLVERISALFLGLAGSVAAGGALLVGGVAASEGRIDPASAALGFFAALALVETAAPLARGIAELGKMTDAARRIEAQFVDEPEAAPRRTALSPFASGDSSVISGHGLVYRRGNRALFEGLDFSVGRGETLALVGESGSGKTTLLNIIRGLVEPTEGIVCLEGLAIADLSEAERAARIGYLPQRATLVSGTIADNLRLAAPAAGDDMLWESLRIAGLDEVVTAKGGLQYPLGEGGQGLSGGERRRLAFARMLLRRPSVMLLDEPTEGLDVETACDILARLRSAFPRAAIVVAAHRAEERAWADRALEIRSP
ncbi:thiol reductant ABC exporter subunit CydC [Ciceribacter ferrooxidans]|uniref:Thiol reductant ABC exporter subunit CydC n=1 Tax=Ciceribacter ferrooxidans TaxID=2509717 RepID=A0A4Q2T1W4_9HYPH|nr:thiol reductant ABC exporter subunit CydC [Ciceribacter ferrooxidans]RYC10950.1 thiol reductant ABC exporter subunit CydC [Ciceribacter ferrooxidans]